MKMRRVVVFLALLWKGSPYLLNITEEPGVRYLMSSAMDVLQHTRIELWKLYLQRQNLKGHASYEIGFLVRTSEERYRKMVDLYNTSVTMDTALRTREHILHLQKIEKLHWDILHLTNMLHEVEKKYKIRHLRHGSHSAGMDEDVQKILSELSWSTKSMFLEYIDYLQLNNTTNTTTLRQMLGHRKSRSFPVEPRRLQVGGYFVDMDIEDDDNGFFRTPRKHIRKARSLASALLSTREFNESLLQISNDEDDNMMKMKLFRLMYESVKDSDLKIKRAELVKSDYENSTAFDIGYVFGDAADKLNVMVDISKTLKRMYDVWKPVEHVNAYEQIANLAIEVTHLVDMVRTIASQPLPSPL